MVYITGDTHRNFTAVKEWAKYHQGDELIILGDAGINYYGGLVDDLEKGGIDGDSGLNGMGIKLFCIHGNHENRPQNIPSYKDTEYRGGKVMYEEAYPNLLFAVDGEIYDFDGIKAIAIGGAYSVDKDIRILSGNKWWNDEQPSDEIKQRVESKLDSVNWSVDIVLSHTCPTDFEPRHLFIPGLDQKLIDKSTEKWLQTIKDRLEFKKWYFGHYHGDESGTIKGGRYQMLFSNIIPLID